MRAPDLLQLFESLVMPMPVTSGSDLSAVKIPGLTTYRLAKDTSGSPCLLIEQPPTGSQAAPLRLENLQVSFGVPCTVTVPEGKKEQDIFTIVRCSADDPALFPHFLNIASPIVAWLGASPTPAAVRRAIFGLVQLFQALAAPAKKTIQGIWAELLLIRLSTDPRATATAWHHEPTERFDFSAGPQRIEVKSSMNRQRAHYFSLEQLKATGGSKIVVASVFAERVGGGVSLRKLFDDTRALLAEDPQLTSRFDSVFYNSLGSGWTDAMDECFDWELAKDSLAFFNAELVPKIEGDIAPAVSDVRFRSDLSGLIALDRAALLDLGGLLAAARQAEA
jgi:hypothetical protein